MKEIPLTQGKVALVSDEDYERVTAHKWYATRRYIPPDDQWVAYRLVRQGGKRRYLALHRFIVGAAAGQIVSPLDGNLLNSQRTNLHLSDSPRDFLMKRRNKRGIAVHLLEEV